jgi:hypothetical protein
MTTITVVNPGLDVATNANRMEGKAILMSTTRIISSSTQSPV